MGAKGIHEIKNHSWFDNFDWRSLEKGEFKSPFYIDTENKNFKLDTSFSINDSSLKNIHEIKTLLK